MQLSVANVSFQMISRALKDHILLVADAFCSKKKKKGRPHSQPHNPNRNYKKVFIHTFELRNIPYCVKKKRQIMYTKPKKMPKFSMFNASLGNKRQLLTLLM